MWSYAIWNRVWGSKPRQLNSDAPLRKTNTLQSTVSKNSALNNVVQDLGLFWLLPFLCIDDPYSFILTSLLSANPTSNCYLTIVHLEPLTLRLGLWCCTQIWGQQWASKGCLDRRDQQVLQEKIRNKAEASGREVFRSHGKARPKSWGNSG